MVFWPLGYYWTGNAHEARRWFLLLGSMLRILMSDSFFLTSWERKGEGQRGAVFDFCSDNAEDEK